MTANDTNKNLSANDLETNDLWSAVSRSYEILKEMEMEDKKKKKEIDKMLLEWVDWIRKFKKEILDDRKHVYLERCEKSKKIKEMEAWIEAEKTRRLNEMGRDAAIAQKQQSMTEMAAPGSDEAPALLDSDNQIKRKVTSTGRFSSPRNFYKQNSSPTRAQSMNLVRHRGLSR